MIVGIFMNAAALYRSEIVLLFPPSISPREKNKTIEITIVE
jgi:hypothetical protein